MIFIYQIADHFLKKNFSNSNNGTSNTKLTIKAAQYERTKLPMYIYALNKRKKTIKAY